jgi:two-component system sensor histidine kinase ChvG
VTVRGPRRRSLRNHAFGIAIAVVAVPLVAVSGTNWFEALFGDRTQDRAADVAGELARTLASGAGVSDQLGARVEAAARARKVLVRVIDGNGRAIASADHWIGTDFWSRLSDLFYGADRAEAQRSWEDSVGPLPGRPEIAAARHDGRDERCHFSTPGNLYICTAALRVATPEGPLVVHVQASTRRALQALYESRRQALKLGLFALALALALAWWASSRIVGPIERLRGEILERASQAVPRAGIDIGRRDELGDLADAFNTVLAALGERNRSNEVFLVDLVHEFKNPVAAIRATAEGLTAGEPADAARLARLAGVLHRSSAHLDALLTQLLELARAEAGLPNEAREPFDLGALVRGLCAGIEADPRYRHLRVEVQVPEAPVRVVGVSDRIESALRNVLDNGASFARHTLRVEVVAGEADAEVRIADDGPGISSDDVPRVFERFFTTRKDRRGTGLGLALARAVVEANGGRIAATSTLGEGATFAITLAIATTLPAARAPVPPASARSR